MEFLLLSWICNSTFFPDNTQSSSLTTLNHLLYHWCSALYQPHPLTGSKNIHNHEIDWNTVNIVSNETNRFARIMKEATAIKRTANNMNRDKWTLSDHLSVSYNTILPLTPRPRLPQSRQRKYESSYWWYSTDKENESSTPVSAFPAFKKNF